MEGIDKNCNSNILVLAGHLLYTLHPDGSRGDNDALNNQGETTMIALIIVYEKG